MGLKKILMLMNNEINYKVSKKEQQLIEFIRNEFRFGKFEVVVHAGQPQRIEMTSPADRVLG